MKIKESTFFRGVSEDAKGVYSLEDSNKICPLWKWELCELRRDDHCCDRMFAYLQEKNSWIVFIPYDRTYAMPYVQLSTKKQMSQLQLCKTYNGEMQILHFCPFCGTSLDNEDLTSARALKMTEVYDQNKNDNESWWEFWERNRTMKYGKLFFSDKWRQAYGLL